MRFPSRPPEFELDKLDMDAIRGSFRMYHLRSQMVDTFTGMSFEDGRPLSD